MVWNLGRLRDRKRITPGQHPFFYQDLPKSREEYDKDFKRDPIEDFQAVFSQNVSALVDKPGRVFIQSESAKKITFGNVWMPKDTLIFKGTFLFSTLSTLANVSLDLFGRLVGERAAGLDLQVTPDVRFRHAVDSSKARVFPTSSASVATRSSQPDIVIGPKVNLSPIAGSVVHWREPVLRMWNSPKTTNVYVFTRRSHSSAENWVFHRETDYFPMLTLAQVPPSKLPAAERPGNRPIDLLNDDMLLSIFGSYRLDDDENWNLQLRWYKLVHVFRKWRHLIYASPSHLNLHLLCRNGTPVADMLHNSPPLPLTIKYQNTRATMAPGDEEGILFALQQRDRVRRIVLHAPSQDLHKFLTALNEYFPTLEHLSILSTADDDARLVMPKAFQAPRLSHLTLLGVTLSAEPRSLTYTVSLVALSLTIPRVLVYIPPEDLAAQLQSVPLLEELTISFSVAIPRSRIRIHAMDRTPAALPALRRFVFRGVSAYLEGLLARISAPHLRILDVTLFNQLTFALPVLSQFISTTAELRFPVANVNFNQTSMSISVSDRTPGEAQGDKSFYVQVSCKPFDWQVNSAAQICSALLRMLAEVKELSLDFYEPKMPPQCQNQVDSRMWYELLGPFRSVKKLHIGHALALNLSCALQPDGSEEPTGLLLPALDELLVEEGCEDDFTDFINAPQRADCPIQLVVCPSRQEPAHPALATQRSRVPRVAHIPMSLDIHLPGSYPGSPRSRLCLPETAPISPLSLHFSPALCSSLGVVEQYLERMRGKPHVIDPVAPCKDTHGR